MGKLYKATLPPNIDPEWLRDLQERVRREDERKLEARRQAGEDLEEMYRSQIRVLMNGANLDIDLDELLRSTANGELNVHR